MNIFLKSELGGKLLVPKMYKYLLAKPKSGNLICLKWKRTLMCSCNIVSHVKQILSELWEIYSMRVVHYKRHGNSSLWSMATSVKNTLKDYSPTPYRNERMVNMLKFCRGSPLSFLSFHTLDVLYFTTSCPPLAIYCFSSLQSNLSLHGKSNML